MDEEYTQAMTNWRTEELLNKIEQIRFWSFTEAIEEIGMDIKDFARQGASEQEWLDSQAMCVVEEAGEFIAEYRRLRGFARTPGTREQMLSELADVIISASLMFEFWSYRPDEKDHSVLPDVVKEKLRKIVTRGYVNKD